MQTFGFGCVPTDGIEGADLAQNILPGNSNLSFWHFVKHLACVLMTVLLHMTVDMGQFSCTK